MPITLSIGPEKPCPWAPPFALASSSQSPAQTQAPCFVQGGPLQTPLWLTPPREFLPRQQSESRSVFELPGNSVLVDKASVLELEGTIVKKVSNLKVARRDDDGWRLHGRLGHES
jgi:hypothetical protein